MWYLWFIVKKIYHLLMNVKFHFWKKYKNWKRLDKFEVHLTDHCNLNCAGCSHFSSIAEKYFMDINHFSNDIERLSKLSGGKVCRLRLMGGEPLLHPDIIQFIEIARRNFPKSIIEICTNGILLGKMADGFWQSCHDNNIEINISYYPINLDYTAINKLALKHKIILKAGIDTSMRNFRNLRMDLNGLQRYKKNWYNCGHANSCVNLYEGKLFTCDVLAHSRHLSKYFDKPLEVAETDYVDIHKARDMKEILKGISKPVKFCKYCRAKEEVVEEWHITEKKITEWAMFG